MENDGATVAPPLISGYEAKRWIEAWAKGERSWQGSWTLGREHESIDASDDGVASRFGGTVPWVELAHLARHPHRCAEVHPDGSLSTLHHQSTETGRQCNLWALENAPPTLMLAGFPMHRTKGTDPWSDTLAKIKAATPIAGAVLDTTMGLGYTAIAAARTARTVHTIEYDPGVIAVAKANPWSRELFRDERITVEQGDAVVVCANLPPSAFDCVLHDPPTIQLAGGLYAETFYADLLRVLKPRGRLFHYVGNPESRQGAMLTRGVLRRLHRAGFRSVKVDPNAFGVVAIR